MAWLERRNQFDRSARRGAAGRRGAILSTQRCDRSEVRLHTLGGAIAPNSERSPGQSRVLIRFMVWWDTTRDTAGRPRSFMWCSSTRSGRPRGRAGVVGRPNIRRNSTLLEPRDGGLEVLQGAEVGDGDLHRDDHLEALPRGDRVDRCPVAGDHAGLLQPLDAPQARRWRQSHPAGQLDIAQPAVVLELEQYFAIDGVKAVWLAHNGRIAAQMETILRADRHIVSA